MNSDLVANMTSLASRQNILNLGHECAKEINKNYFKLLMCAIVHHTRDFKTKAKDSLDMKE